jgi:hypothetical protein
MNGTGTSSTSKSCCSSEGKEKASCADSEECKATCGGTCDKATCDKPCCKTEGTVAPPTNDSLSVSQPSGEAQNPPTGH